MYKFEDKYIEVVGFFVEEPKSASRCFTSFLVHEIVLFTLNIILVLQKKQMILREEQ